MKPDNPRPNLPCAPTINIVINTAITDRAGARAGGGLRVPKGAAAAGIVLGAALLCGCETIPTLAELAPSEREAAWRTHARVLSRFQSWTLLGNLVVRSHGKAGRVIMRWRQAPGSYLVRFSARLGTGLFEIEGSVAGVEARFADGRRTRAVSPEAFLERELGWSVPLEGLRHWIVGAVAPGGAPARIELNGQGRLARLEQAGWTVVYERYGGLDDLALPERIRFSNGSVTVTANIRQWKAAPEPGSSAG